MKKSVIFVFAFFLLAPALPAQTYLNKIGFDFYSPYMVKSPKYNLPGNKYNADIKSTGGSFGLFYERAFKNHSFSLRTGAYLNSGLLVSFYVPVEFNGDILGNSKETTLFLGYSAGLNFNFPIAFTTSVFLPDNVISVDSQIKKTFYIAPDVGINAGINLGHFFISFQGLFNFFIPEFVAYKTVYKDETGKQITEYNTNDNWGITIRTGAGYRF